MGLRDRLERLEAIEGEGPDEYERERRRRSRRSVRRLLRAIARARREAGLEAGDDEPEPYTAEDRADDEEILREVIPAYRANAGYQNERGREFLDHWEQHIRDNLAKGAGR